MYLVFCTAPNKKEAKHIAKTLIMEKLASCVSLLNVMQSIYIWKGKLACEQEVLLMIKTSKKNYTEMEKKIKSIHTYSVPEIIAISPSKINKKYLSWINSI